MDSQEQQQQIQTVSIANPYLLRLKCFLCQALNPNINDENNNLKKTNNSNEKSFNPISKLPLYTCPDCEAKIRLDEKESASISTVTSQELEEESDRMIIVPDTSSEENDDECWCQSCRNDDDEDSRQYWEDLSHIIKCVYRATDKQFQDNQFSADISKAKEYVKILTDLNPQMLFNRLESIVLEYVREIRQQVSERFHTCAKTSPDVQLFISFLLDEYQMFIQAATNVSMIISYLEDNYMKSFDLSWLLYNKHLYEKFIYMDRKIQHSMSTMIDLLQPSNDEEEDDDNDDDNRDNNNNNTYSSSPSEYTQLLNRLLAFDEEMSQIACLYKKSQAKLISQPLHVCNRNEYSSSKSIKQNKKKKKSKKNKKSKKLSDDNSTSIPMDITSSTSVSAPQGSNGSSIGSGHGGDESSSASSFDDYLLDNETSSSGYTQEEQEELTRLILEDDFEEHFNQQLLKDIFESVSPLARIQHQINLDDGDQWIGGIFQGVRSQSNKNEINQQPTMMTTAAATTTTVCTTSKPSESSSTKKSSSKSKSNKSSHRRKESSTHAQPTNTTTQLPKKSIPSDLFLPRSIADLSAKIQSVSFTAGTFGSITSTNSNETVSSPSTTTLSSSPTNCSTTTLTAAKTTTSTGQTRLSINLTRKPGSKTEHGGQKIAEALFNELTSLGNGECLNNGRKKDNQQFKKTKQQSQRSTINETSLNSSSTTAHSFFNSSNKSDMNSSSTTALHNLDHLLRHAASNADVSEATLHSIISSLHSPTCHDSSSKTAEKIQALLAQQQHFHHQQQQQQQKKHFSPNKHCEFCCCDFPEGRRCSSTATCLHLSSNATNGPIASCVTCMALPGSATTTTTTSVMGTAIAGVFNQRDVERKERLKLKLNRRNVQNCSEQQNSDKDQTKKTPAVTKEPTATIPNTTTTTTSTKNNSKSKDVLLNDKNNIDDLVRFIDGDEKTSTNHHEHQTSTTNGNETTSKKKKKKDKQSKNNEETKSSSSSQQQRGQTTNQKKQNGSNGNQQTTDSQQQSRSTSSSSTVTETQPTLSKRKQKAKLKLEQQQQQQEKQATDNTEKSATTTTTDSDKTNVSTPAVSTTVPSSIPLVSSVSNSSSQGTNSTRTDVDLPLENFDSPEEEVNWITISRKQGKHKPTPPSVPSLLAAPIPPVVSPLNSKPHRQQQQGTNNTKKNTTTTANNSSLTQHKVMSNNVTPSNVTLENGSTNPNKQQHNAAAPPRLQNVLKNHASHQLQKVESIQPSVQPWSNNIHEHTPVIPPVASPSTLLPTASTYLPTPPVPVGGGPSIPPSSMYWDPNVYLHSSSSSSSSPTRFMSSTAPGPVQRPNSSFSPAPGTVNNNNNNTTTSRCIQRPSPEPRSCSTNSVPFPLYSPMNYAVGNSNSTWTDTSGTNTHGSQWNFPQEQQLGPSTPATDFPLYDPFHSGATLTIPSTVQTPLLNNGYPEHFGDFCGVPLDNDVNEMDALDKEIEDFKKFCFETVPLKPREKVQVNVDRCFVRQT